MGPQGHLERGFTVLAPLPMVKLEPPGRRLQGQVCLWNPAARLKVLSMDSMCPVII